MGFMVSLADLWLSWVPIVGTFMALFICCLVGFVFKSLFLGLKLVVTVVVPVLAGYGLLTSVFQMGYGKPLGFQHYPDGVLYIQPFITFGFLMGLAIDYDIFLFSRVYERRMAGYDNRSAVKLALSDTGPTISVAGILMALSFVFLMTSDIPMIQQNGFLYFMGIMFDTFVIRTLVAPAALCYWPAANYWPGKVPAETKSFKGWDNEN